jgi:hypothetical protein
VTDPDLLDRLERSLRRRRWKDADTLTGSLLREAVQFDREREQLTGLDVLARVDALWSEASDGRFGTGRQLEVYRDEARRDYELFATYVGWRRRGRYLLYCDLTFDLSAPPGHLPTGGPDGLFGEMGLDLPVLDELKEAMKAMIPLYTRPAALLGSVRMAVKVKRSGKWVPTDEVREAGRYFEKRGYLPALEWLEGHIALFRRLEQAGTVPPTG